MTVSVIIPAYNAGCFLRAALASVAAQSRPADEVVVIDDASTDDTLAVAERWSDHLPLVLVRKQANEGLGAARRDGIANSSGDRLALLDADDYLLPDHLEVVLACHERHGGIVAASGYRWVPNQRIATTPWNVLAPVPPPGKQHEEILRRNFLFSNVVISRTSYERSGGFRALRSDEDWDLWIRMIRAGSRVMVPETVTVIFRNHPGSLSSAEGYLPWDIKVLEGLMDDVSDGERPIVERALRRRHARVRLLHGYELARSGRVADARFAWLRAAIQDRSLQGGLSPAGSVALRAMLCLLAPRQMVQQRDRRAAKDVRLG